MYSCNLCNEDLDGKNFWRCSECTVAIYCGKNCQRSDWKVHKRHCKDLKSYVLLQKEKAKDEHSKIEDDTYERRILDLDIRTLLEKEDIHNWVKDHPWPSEEKIRSWIKDKTPNKITTDTESNLIQDLGKHLYETQYDYYDHDHFKAMFNGFTNSRRKEHLYHHGEVRRIGWLIGDKYGKEGMIASYYLFVRICNDPHFFTYDSKYNSRSVQNLHPMQMFGKSIELAWKGVHGWII